MRRSLANFGLMLFALLLALALVEAMLLVLAGFRQTREAGAVYRYEDVYVSNRPLAVFDPITGYRRPPGSTRIVRISHDTLVFDQTFTPNNANFISTRDYAHKKPPGTTRVVVFGDSFTASEYNPLSWPDRVHEALRGRTARPMELYSFAAGGTGLGIWSTIFFDDVLPHYDFDAVVIASWGDDLARGFGYLHYEGSKAYLGYFPTRVRSREEFVADYIPKLKPYYATVATDAEIDAMIASLEAGWRWPGFQFRSGPLVMTEWRRFREGRYRAPPAVAGTATALPNADPADIAAIEAKYGAPQFGLLRAMMDACRERGIPVVFAAMPDSAGARIAAESKGKTETPHQKELRTIAAHFGALYMDGYAPFATVPPDDIADRYWLKYDAHWNQAGSDLFAQAMTEFLARAEGQLVGRSKP